MATYYVNFASGNDGNSGTSIVAPWKNFPVAVSRLIAGDFLRVMGDAPYPIGAVNIDITGTSTNPIVISNYNSTPPWIVPSGAEEYGMLWGLNQRYVIIDGINIDASTGANIFAGFKIESFIFGGTFNPHHITYKNFELIGPVSGGALTNGAISILVVELNPGLIGSNTFQYGTLHGGGVDNFNFSYCFYIANHDTLIENCDMSDASGFLLQLFNGNDGAPPPTNNIIRKNRFHDLTRSPDDRVAAIINVADNTQIYNNYFYNIRKPSTNTGDGIQIYDGTNCVVYNNSVYNCAGVGINVLVDANNTIVRNNASFGSNTNILNSGAGSIVNTNFTSDPSWVNPSSGNLNLSSGSPCINAGATIPLVTDDIIGTSRPQDLAYDIGAFEFVFTPSIPTSGRAIIGGIV